MLKNGKHHDHFGKEIKVGDFATHVKQSLNSPASIELCRVLELNVKSIRVAKENNGTVQKVSVFNSDNLILVKEG